MSEVLIVDQDPWVREELEEKLRRRGFLVAAAPDWSHMIAHLLRERTSAVLLPPDVVGVTPRELAYFLRNRGPEAPRFFLHFQLGSDQTASARERITSTLGADGHVSSAGSSTEVADCLEQLLGAPTPRRRGARTSRECILVAVLEPSVRMRLGRILRHAGNEVRRLGSWAEVIDAVQAGAEPGLVFLGKGLHPRSEAEGVEELRVLVPEARVILVLPEQALPEELGLAPRTPYIQEGSVPLDVLVTASYARQVLRDGLES